MIEQKHGLFNTDWKGYFAGMSRSNVLERDGAEWLRVAMSQLLRSGTGNLLCAGRSEGSPRAIRGKPDPRLRRRYHEHVGLHNHPFVGVYVALQGKAAFDLEKKRYVFEPPMLAVLEKGVVHSEARLAGSTGHAMLWMYGAEASMIAAVSRYRADEGWDIPFRYSLRSRFVRRLFDRLTGDANMSPDLLEPVRAELMAVLGELHLRESTIQKPTAQKESWRWHEHMLRQIRAFLDANLDQKLRIEDLAGMARLSPNYLNRLFREWTGEGLHSYLIRKRMEKALTLCSESSLLIKEIAAEVGYEDELYFSRAFKRHHGRSPREVKSHRSR